jgi:hypothetical protein
MYIITPVHMTVFLSLLTPPIARVSIFSSSLSTSHRPTLSARPPTRADLTRCQVCLGWIRCCSPLPLPMVPWTSMDIKSSLVVRLPAYSAAWAELGTALSVQCLQPSVYPTTPSPHAWVVTRDVSFVFFYIRYVVFLRAIVNCTV